MSAQELNLDECFDENGVFYFNFGNVKTSVQFLLSLIPDENESDPPTVEIQDARGFTDLQIRELKGEIEDLTENDYYAEWFDFPNLIFRVNEYLYARTGEDDFRDKERERQKAEKEKAKVDRELQKKIDQENAQQELIARRALQKQQREEQEERERKAKKAEEDNKQAALERFQAQVRAMNELQRQRMREQLILQKKRRTEQQIRADEELNSHLRQERISAAQAALYGPGKGERPNADEYGGPNNGYLLENLELGYHDGVTLFSRTYSKIQKVPFILGELTNLAELNLSFNNITQIPVSIRNLVNLQKLILCDNKITMLPPIDTLVNLRVLDVRKNCLALLPDFEALVSLQSLSADENRISLVPNTIAECKALHYINLSNNKLSLLPPEIANLPKLEVLKLINNPMRMIPAELYHRGTQHVLNYLKTYIPSTTLAQSLFRNEGLGKTRSPASRVDVARSDSGEPQLKRSLQER